MTAPLLTIACDVSVEDLRCDLYDPSTGTLYRGAALHGAGGLVTAGRNATVDEARRRLVLALWSRMKSGTKALVYTRCRADGAAIVELEPGKLEVRAVYLPGQAERSAA